MFRVLTDIFTGLFYLFCVGIIIAGTLTALIPAILTIVLVIGFTGLLFVGLF